MTDTIAAVATAHGIGSIAIVRVSGPRALEAARALTGDKPLTPRHAHLLPLHDVDGALIDEAIVLYFQAPRSFTGEEIVEFQCHGGSIVAQSVLEALMQSGVRPAEPGEFSKRAYHNGRIDLSEAEAIARLIEAQSDDAARILARQMKGELRRYVDTARDTLIRILAHSEVAIDYAEEDLPEDLVMHIKEQLAALAAELDKTLRSSESRRGLMQGFRVAIVGKPNVGKSSLLNTLLDYNRAIVSDIAGTTRDTIEEQLRIGTHLIRIVDTAGIRHASDQIERIGVERTLEAIGSSDIVVALFDGSRPFDAEDARMMELLTTAEPSVITVINKADLPQYLDPASLTPFDPLRLSTKQGVEPLITHLRSLMDVANDSESIMLISRRQITAVRDAVTAIREAALPLDDGELELFSFHINTAITALASITRPFEHDEMLDKMFGEFCLGK